MSAEARTTSRPSSAESGAIFRSPGDGAPLPDAARPSGVSRGAAVGVAPRPLFTATIEGPWPRPDGRVAGRPRVRSWSRGRGRSSRTREKSGRHLVTARDEQQASLRANLARNNHPLAKGRDRQLLHRLLAALADHRERLERLVIVGRRSAPQPVERQRERDLRPPGALGNRARREGCARRWECARPSAGAGPWRRRPRDCTARNSRTSSRRGMWAMRRSVTSGTLSSISSSLAVRFSLRARRSKTVLGMLTAPS